MLIEGDVSGQWIGLGFEILNQRLPIHLVNGDAGKVRNADRVRARARGGQQRVELQILAQRASATEHFISVLRLRRDRPIDAPGTVESVRKLAAERFDRLSLLVTKPGGARNVAIQKPPVMIFLCR